VRRGEIWTAAAAQEYAGKPRPVLILQDDRFAETESVIVCPFTSDPTDAPLFRLPVVPGPGNGLRILSRLMVDKITPIPKSKFGARVGRLADEDLIRLNRAVMVFLGIASTPDR
jgi:mRNA interferase MazF